ncbi:MAG: trypsin-like serine peptidase [Acidimicrobiales bacterium]
MPSKKHDHHDHDHGEVEATAEHPHGRNYELWDFLPQLRHHLGEHGVPERESDLADTPIESICGGTNDAQEVEQYDGALGPTTAFVAAHERPVGQLQWNDDLATKYAQPGNVSGVRWCSGTLISCDLFLSAGHCFDRSGGGWSRPIDGATGEVISEAEIATNMHVNFNYQLDPDGNLRTEDSFPVLELVEYRLGSLDFAVVRLGGNPGRHYGYTRVATGDAAVGDLLTIIGHPMGLPKKIEAGPLTDLHAQWLGYNDIDTLGGNSGSGVLGPDGRVVGVHTNGGCDPSMTGHNHGVRISSILAASPTVSALATSKSVLSDLACGLKFKILDDPAKRPYFDHGPLKGLLDKRLGDVKLTAYDTHVYDPTVVFGQPPATGLAPFVLATPHHAGSMVALDPGRAGVSLADVSRQLATLRTELDALAAVVESQLAGSAG